MREPVDHLTPALAATLARVALFEGRIGRLPSSTELDDGRRGRMVRHLQQLERLGMVARADGATWRNGELTAHGRLTASMLPPGAETWTIRKKATPLHDGDRTMFRGRVVTAPETAGRSGLRALKEGNLNRKLGGWVGWGRWAGARIVQLSLEERRTCPRSCAVWSTCYGNNMPLAFRHRVNGALYAALEADLDFLTARGRGTVAVRLHGLGDFPSVEYLDFWTRQIAERPNVSVFGFTAHAPDSQIGALIQRQPWDRFAIRFSGHGGARGAVVRGYEPSDGYRPFRCAEQRGARASCADCAACWESTDPVVFDLH